VVARGICSGNAQRKYPDLYDFRGNSISLYNVAWEIGGDQNGIFA